MLEFFSRMLDRLSTFLAPRKGLLPIIGMVLIVLNFVFRLVYVPFLTPTDFLLHLGLIIVIFGFMLARAL